MKSFSAHLLAAFLAVAVLAGCSQRHVLAPVAAADQIYVWGSQPGALPLYVNESRSERLLPVSADGYYQYLIAAGFDVAGLKELPPSDGADRVIGFILADAGSPHRMRVFQFPGEAGARAYQATMQVHKLTSVCGPLVVVTEAPLPRARIESAFENALDIYVAKAQHGLLNEIQVEVASDGPSLRRPVRTVRNMFMLSRDSVVYSNPTTASASIGNLSRDSYIHVIDLLPDFLKVRMRDGAIGFIPEHSVE